MKRMYSNAIRRHPTPVNTTYLPFTSSPSSSPFRHHPTTANTSQHQSTPSVYHRFLVFFTFFASSSSFPPLKSPLIPAPATRSRPMPAVTLLDSCMIYKSIECLRRVRRTTFRSATKIHSEKASVRAFIKAATYRVEFVRNPSRSFRPRQYFLSEAFCRFSGLGVLRQSQSQRKHTGYEARLTLVE
jgi:hypothetical protein